jgi:hypothetical protein
MSATSRSTLAESGDPSADAGDAGVQSNARLTAVTGLVLLVMLAVEGYTILDVQGMITLHIFLGVMLVGPVLLKTATTMYRFTRYYQHKAAYVRRGPPHMILRVLGPVVILSSLTVLGTGIGLLAVHSRDGGTLLTAHQASFIVWVSAMTLHVLGHVKEAAISSWKELRLATPARGRRFIAVLVAVIVGVAGAAILLPTATQWTHRSPDRFGYHRH